MVDRARGLGITNAGHHTRLKWHRLRRSFADPLFSGHVMAEGFTLGASMELDLRVRADHGFVVLHDEALGGETTGTGLVRRASAQEIRAVTIHEGGHAPILSEDLANMLETAHPDAVLQFDMKDGLADIGERGLHHLRDHFAGAGRSIIVSGADLELVAAVKQHLPGVSRGIDPTDKLVEIHHQQGLAAAEAELKNDVRGAIEPDMVYLSWQLVLAAAREGLDLIGLVHDLGRTVDAWTFNLKSPDSGFSPSEAEDFSTLMALKPDQITTDEAPATERAWEVLSTTT